MKGGSTMATKVINFKIDELEVAVMKEVASVYHITLTEIIKEAVSEYVSKLKNDPFYKLTVNVKDAEEDESNEILSSINNLTDDDLIISSSRHSYCRT